MCWNMGVSAAMVGVGVGASIYAYKSGFPRPVWMTITYFSLMEVLQLSSYPVVDQCGSFANEALVKLSFAHIVFQPFFVNAMALSLVDRDISGVTQRLVYALCAVATGVMLLQILAVDLAGPCRPGDTLCGLVWCVRSGDWHLAWEVPYRLLTPGGTTFILPDAVNFRLSYGLMTYPLAFFAIPLIYGAWRFSLYNMAAGPFLARALSDDPNEIPAIWCLFSVAIFLIVLLPPLRSALGFRKSLVSGGRDVGATG